MRRTLNSFFMGTGNSAHAVNCLAFFYLKVIILDLLALSRF